MEYEHDDEQTQQKIVVSPDNLQQDIAARLNRSEAPGEADYENPADAGADNVYSVTVQVSDISPTLVSCHASTRSATSSIPAT